MRTPDLLQRMKMKPQTDSMRGFDARFRLDYMGSAEFEFGSLPKSAKRICLSRDTHVLQVATPNLPKSTKHKLFVFGAKNNVEEYMQFIPGLLKDEYRTKEWTGIPESLGLVKDAMFQALKGNFDAWWDIDNDVFLCRGIEVGMAVNKGIGEVIEQKKLQGANDWLPPSMLQS